MTAAARMALLRERRRSGRLVVAVELDADDLETLIEARVLNPRQDCHSRESIATAVRSYLKISRDA